MIHFDPISYKTFEEIVQNLKTSLIVYQNI